MVAETKLLRLMCIKTIYTEPENTVCHIPTFHSRSLKQLSHDKKAQREQYCRKWDKVTQKGLAAGHKPNGELKEKSAGTSAHTGKGNCIVQKNNVFQNT